MYYLSERQLLFFGLCAGGGGRGGGGGWGVQPSPPEIPKALQNRAKLNPIVKTLRNCWI